MCGIAGHVASAGAPVGLHAAAVALGQRGPDGTGAQCATGNGWWCELVHTRLAIVDLSADGDQPMTDESGRFVMVFNGEIYNSPELRARCESRGHRFRSRMDGEVILHLWEDEGASALGRLNGIFAVCVLDTGTGDVVIARDPIGVKPLFYNVEGSTLRFASELRALAATGADLGPPDLVGLAQFLTFLWIPDPRTPYARARSLEPGQALRWSNGTTTTFRYATWSAEAGEASADELRENFVAAARRQLLSDVPIGLMASGGLDSSLIWWVTRDAVKQAYCIRWPSDGLGERLDEDATAVTALEREFGTSVAYLPGENAEAQLLPPSGDLFADPAYELSRFIARSAQEDGIKVLLSGQGGDEVFGGYRRQTVTPLIERLPARRLAGLAMRAASALPVGAVRAEYAHRLGRAFGERDPFRAYMQLCSYSTAEDRARALDCTVAEVADDVVWERHQEVFDRQPREASLLRKAMAVDLGVYLPGLGLAYVDRAGMEFGVEIRVPWLDLELIRWSLGLPDEALVSRGSGKVLPRALAARELPELIAARPKRGFAAPAQAMRPATSRGERGFRQGSYFGRATEILNGFLEKQHA